MREEVKTEFTAEEMESFHHAGEADEVPMSAHVESHLARLAHRDHIRSVAERRHEAWAIEYLDWMEKVGV